MIPAGWIPHLVMLALVLLAASLFATYANPALGLFLADWMIC